VRRVREAGKPLSREALGSGRERHERGDHGGNPVDEPSAKEERMMYIRSK